MAIGNRTISHSPAHTEIASTPLNRCCFDVIVLSCVSDSEMLYHLVISLASIHRCVRGIFSSLNRDDLLIERSLIRQTSIHVFASIEFAKKKNKSRRRRKSSSQTYRTNWQSVSFSSIDFINGSRLASIPNHRKWPACFREGSRGCTVNDEDKLANVNHFYSSDLFESFFPLNQSCSFGLVVNSTWRLLVAFSLKANHLSSYSIWGTLRCNSWPQDWSAVLRTLLFGFDAQSRLEPVTSGQCLHFFVALDIQGERERNESRCFQLLTSIWLLTMRRSFPGLRNIEVASAWRGM